MSPPYVPFTVDRFLGIRSDAKYSRYLDAAEVIRWISALPGMSRSGSNRVSRYEGDHPLQILVVRCDDGGNWPRGSEGEPVNLIELRCDDSDEALRAGYEAIAVVIAGNFGWEVADDRDGSVLWNPGQAATAAIRPTRFD